MIIYKKPLLAEINVYNTDILKTISVDIATDLSLSSDLNQKYLFSLHSLHLHLPYS